MEVELIALEKLAGILMSRAWLKGCVMRVDEKEQEISMAAVDLTWNKEDWRSGLA